MKPLALFPVPIASLELKESPIFFFTTDIEWAPEWAIAAVLTFFRERQLPLTPFLTHSSAVFNEHFDRWDMHRRVGLHPNFLTNSSHGKTREQVIDCVFRLWPGAVSFRSHCFYEDSPTVTALKERGIQYDSNLCLFLQPSCVPLLHHTGVVRFPVFWEDDVHFNRRLPFQFGPLKKYFAGPGLKVINIHPLMFALNVPTLDFYVAYKHLNGFPDPEEGKKACFQGQGTRTFLEELTEHVHQTKAAALYLDDFYRSLL